MVEKRRRRKALWGVLARKDVPELDRLARWWSQDRNCLNDSLLCLLLKPRHTWAFERLVTTGYPVCWRTVRQVAVLMTHAEGRQTVSVAWPLLVPAVRESDDLKTELLRDLVDRAMPLEHVGILRLGDVFDPTEWERPMDFGRTGQKTDRVFTPLQWAVFKKCSPLVQKFVELGASPSTPCPTSSWPDWTLAEAFAQNPQLWRGVEQWLGSWLRERALEATLPPPNGLEQAAPSAALTFKRGPRF